MDPIRGHVCRSCRLKLATPRVITQPRSFSTTTTLSIVPPESPYYVDIPSSYQAFSPYQPKQKGHLPTPREIFPANRPDKPSPQYLANVTADPLAKNIKKPSQLSTMGKHKVKMAEKRRHQLREGLTALHARKQADLNAMSSRSQAKQRERENLLSQAEREDARLTNVSVPQAMKPAKKDAQSTIAALEAQIANAKAIHAQKLANYEAAKQMKHEEKMDALHTLYMNARSFVTTEAQLTTLLKEQFDDNKRFQNDEGEGDSLWHLGAPVSVKDMIADATGRPRTRIGSASGAVLSTLSGKDRFASGQKDVDEIVSRDQERLKKIAEKLSGGKI